MSKIYKDLLDFQKSIRSVTKDSKGYGYTYASLDTIVETIAPKLEEVGLGYFHRFDGNRIVCTLFNAEGETIESSLEMVSDNAGKMSASQQQGSAITYARRYTLSAILGLVTDEDNDGATNTPKATQNTRQVPKKAPKPMFEMGSEAYTKAVDNFSKFDHWSTLEKALKSKYTVQDDVLSALQTEYNISKSDLLKDSKDIKWNDNLPKSVSSLAEDYQ